MSKPEEYVIKYLIKRPLMPSCPGEPTKYTRRSGISNLAVKNDRQDALNTAELLNRYFGEGSHWVETTTGKRIEATQQESA